MCSKKATNGSIFDKVHFVYKCLKLILLHYFIALVLQGFATEWKSKDSSANLYEAIINAEQLPSEIYIYVYELWNIG